jgi:hypothetical protein
MSVGAARTGCSTVQIDAEERLDALSSRCDQRRAAYPDGNYCRPERCRDTDSTAYVRDERRFGENNVGGLFATSSLLVIIRLTKKLAEVVNGCDLRPFNVGQVINLTDRFARMLIAERWAEQVTPFDVRATANERSRPEQRRPKQSPRTKTRQQRQQCQRRRVES